jgi:putative two-component system response regulator
MTKEEKIHAAKILIVDDQPVNVVLLEKILKAEGFFNIEKVTDSRRTLDVYGAFMPDIVLLDLSMPYMDGFQVMDELKKIEDETHAFIIVLTALTDRDSRIKALSSGAKDFIGKPFDRLELLTRIRNLLEIRLLHNELIQYNAELEQRVEERTREISDTQLEIVRRLGRASEYRDNETGFHIMRMSRYSALLAKAYGMSERDSDAILHASPMHDLGKIGIRDGILLKPGKLDPDEWETMKRHTIIGAEILSGHDSEIIVLARTVAITHHEKWDGTGYPRGIGGENIPLAGRICSVADVFDSLTSKRPYKEPWPVEKAVAELVNMKESNFEPRLVDLFVEILPEILKVKEQFQE